MRKGHHGRITSVPTDQRPCVFPLSQTASITTITLDATPQSNVRLTNLSGQHRGGLFRSIVAPILAGMGNTINAPPIARILSWLEHWRSLCLLYQKAPKDGDWFCSESCRGEYNEFRAHG